MSAFTPGPWRTGKKRGNELFIYDAHNRLVAGAEFDPPERAGSHDQMRPNAVLIAAAPELVEALQLQETAEKLRETCKECHGRNDYRLCTTCIPHFSRARQARKKALKKAEDH